MACSCGRCGGNEEYRKGLEAARKIASQPLSRDTILDRIDAAMARPNEERYIEAGMPK